MTGALVTGALATDAPASRFRWDDRLGRYRDAATGRLVREAAVRDALDAALSAAESRTQALAALVRERRVPLREWERQMRLVVKDAELQAVAAARGGWAQVTPADLGRVGAACRRQYAYLRRFRDQLASGAQPLDGRFAARMALYPEAARHSYTVAERAERVRRGATEERNVRHAADSCPGCVRLTARGWVPVGTLPPTGQQQCRARCKCTREYR